MRSAAFVAPVIALLASSASAQPEVAGPPSSMACLGDSMTLATAATAGSAATNLQYSWCTGTNANVQSLYLRLLALESTLAGNADNFAQNGARVADIAAQAASASGASPKPELVTVLIGANDACATSRPDAGEFGATVRGALSSLSTALPEARLYVLSIPDISQLWTLFSEDLTARGIWAYGICPTFLSVTGNDAADAARRDAGYQDLVAYNAALRDACAQFIHCRFDQQAIFQSPIAAGDVSTVDYFHPSVQGQGKLAAVAWSAGFDFSDQTPPVSTAVGVRQPADAGAIVYLSATDDVGVSGLELRRDDGGTWMRYDAPFAVPTSGTVVYRAVDVNGNTEAARGWDYSMAVDSAPDAGTAPDAGEGSGGGGGVIIGGEVDHSAPDTPAGCGCGAAGGLSALAMLLAALVLAATRRRVPRS